MAKNNEAKIRFTAETGEFNSEIKKSNDEMSKLRAELKLNATQMKSNGASVEALEDKHRILTDQLAASESKTEALAQKVEKAAEIFGENSAEVNKLRTQLINAQTAEEKIRQAISDCNDELEAQRKASKQAESASEQLADTIGRQQNELNDLKKEYSDAVLTYGKNSKEAKTLAKEIDSLSDELKDNQKALGKAESAADKLDNSYKNAGDAARDSADGFTVAKGAIADLASEAIQSAIGKVTEFVGWLKELPEATREIRQDMATLETSFESAGFTTEQATNTWKELYTVFGEDDRAVETANLISKMAKNQQDLNDWVTITKGIWGSYQDSLPVEGLAEASNETAKTGKVTGVLADALNWSSEAAVMFADYMSEDVTTAEDAFNEALNECTTEAERQALITETLTALYGEAAAKYEEASGAQLDAKEATAENVLAQNNLADAIEPVTTAWQELKNDALEAILPVVQSVSDTITDMLGWMQEHPVAVKAIAAAVGVLAVGLGGLATAAIIYTAAQWAMNSAILANPITWIIVGVIAAIAAVVAIVVVLIEYWDEVVAAVKNCWEAVKATLAKWGEWINTNVIQPIVKFFTGLWDSVTSACGKAWEWIKNLFLSFVGWINEKIIQPVLNFYMGLWEGVKAVWDGICNAISIAVQLIGSILSAAFQIITLPFRFIWENCKEYVFAAWEWIKNAVSTAINAVKNTITTVWNAVKTVFSTVWNAIKNVVGSAWEWISSKVTNAINAVKTVITTVWNAVKSVTSTVWNAIKTVISTVWNSIKSAVSTAVNGVKSVVSSVWNGIKSVTSSVWNGIKTTISSVVNGVKSTVSNVFNGIKSTTTSVWNGIKNAIITPIETARDKIKGIIDKIKGFFSGMKLEFPGIKLPHFSIKPSGWSIGDLLKGSIPSLGIEWYKDGGIMMKPTIFGAYGNSLMAGGEAGPEAILPIDRLEGYISGAIEKSMNVVNLQSLADAIEDLASRPISVAVNGREVALATAGDFDSVNGLRNTFSGRGLVLD